MLCTLAAQFAHQPVLVVTDSWFGNAGLYQPLQAFSFDLLSRLRANINLYELPPPLLPQQRGRSLKYGAKLGSVSQLADCQRAQAQTVSVYPYDTLY